MSTRIYLIESKAGDKTLVEASSQAQALRHATEGHFTSKTATTMEVATLMKSGAVVEKAGEKAVA